MIAGEAMIAAQAVLLDAGGVLVWPNWTRMADALGRQGIADIDCQCIRSIAELPAMLALSDT